MLPGTTRSHVIPSTLEPAKIGCIDVNLASHLLEKFGNLNHSNLTRARLLNAHLSDLNIVEMWNGCNGIHVDFLSELSLDATPRNHYFVNRVPTPEPHTKKLRYLSIQRYFEEKYSIKLNLPHSPLLRDLGGRLYPIETIWLRLRVFEE